MSHIRINILVALRAAKGEPLPVSVLISGVANASRAERGDVEGEMRRMQEQGLITTTTDAATDAPAAMLTTKGQATANQLR